VCRSLQPHLYLTRACPSSKQLRGSTTLLVDNHEKGGSLSHCPVLTSASFATSLSLSNNFPPRYFAAIHQSPHAMPGNTDSNAAISTDRRSLGLHNAQTQPKASNKTSEPRAGQSAASNMPGASGKAVVGTKHASIVRKESPKVQHTESRHDTPPESRANTVGAPRPLSCHAVTHPTTQLSHVIQGDIDALRHLVTCKICTRLLYEPYVIACGHTFCYSVSTVSVSVLSVSVSSAQSEMTDVQ